jgi:hypothetical protein
LELDVPEPVMSGVDDGLPSKRAATCSFVESVPPVGLLRRMTEAALLPLNVKFETEPVIGADIAMRAASPE